MERKTDSSRLIQMLEKVLRNLRQNVVDEGELPTVEQIYERIGL